MQLHQVVTQILVLFSPHSDRIDDNNINNNNNNNNNMNDHIISKQHPIKAVGTEYVTLYTSTGFLPIVLFSPSQHAYILPNLKIITLNFRRSQFPWSALFPEHSSFMWIRFL